jgi:hypothetical protein
MFPQWGPYGERCSTSRAISQSPHLSKEPSHEMGGKIQWPSMEPHANGRFANNAVRPGSPRELFTTLLSLPHCHSALSRVSLPHLLPPSTWPMVQIHLTLMYEWWVGFMGGKYALSSVCYYVTVSIVQNLPWPFDGCSSNLTSNFITMLSHVCHFIVARVSWGHSEIFTSYFSKAILMLSFCLCLDIFTESKIVARTLRKQ